MQVTITTRFHRTLFSVPHIQGKKIAQIIYFLDFTVDKIIYLCYNKGVKRNTQTKRRDER